MNKLFINSAMLIALSGIIFVGCKKDDNNEKKTIETPDTTKQTQPYDNGIFIANQGPFQNGTGSICFYSRTNKTMTYDIFNKENSRPLGNIVQSVEIFNSKAYIIVNNADKVEVVNSGTFKSVGVINGLKLPRYFTGIDKNKGYISEYGQSDDGSINVINLNDYSIIKKIPTHHAADKMLLFNNILFVANSAGNTVANDSTITVIDTQSDNIINTIIVGHNPNALVLDKNNKIWVICAGINDWSNPGNNTKAKIIRLNPTNYSIEQTLELQSGYFDTRLCINNTKEILFYTYNGKVYSMLITDTNLQQTPIINKNFYEISTDNKEISKNILYGADPKNYTQDGYIFRYEVSNNNATLIDSMKVGIVPSGFYFN